MWVFVAFLIHVERTWSVLSVTCVLVTYIKGKKALYKWFLCFCLDGPEVHCLSGLREGETLDGHCTVTGYPSPVVSWQKDGQPIVPAMIMSRDDTGTYTVEAVGASRVKKTIPILVMCECPFRQTCFWNCGSFCCSSHFAHFFIYCFSHLSYLQEMFFNPARLHFLLTNCLQANVLLSVMHADFGYSLIYNNS